jgi:hypothetical protein
MWTDSFTRCWKNKPLVSVAAGLRALMKALTWAVLLVAMGIPLHAAADTAELSSFALERAEDGVYLSATVKMELPSVVDDVLRKGIPVFFVAEVELRRERWYWSDKPVTRTARHMRLAYQPLLRRWRLQVAPSPIGNNGLGVTLSQNFESMPDALAAIQRFARWKIADPADLEADGRYNVDFAFRLDVSQLPRPFQIGALGQTEWSLGVSRNQKLPTEISR